MREELEKLKNDLECKKTYSNKDLLVIPNKITNTLEILLPKREEKQNKNNANRLYRNLKDETVKIIIKKGFVYVLPKRYGFNYKTLDYVLQEEEKMYFLDELKEIEENLNSLKSSKNR